MEHQEPIPVYSEFLSKIPRGFRHRRGIGDIDVRNFRGTHEFSVRTGLRHGNGYSRIFQYGRQSVPELGMIFPSAIAIGIYDGLNYESSFRWGTTPSTLQMM